MQRHTFTGHNHCSIWSEFSGTKSRSILIACLSASGSFAIFAFFWGEVQQLPLTVAPLLCFTASGLEEPRFACHSTVREFFSKPQKSVKEIHPNIASSNSPLKLIQTWFSHGFNTFQPTLGRAARQHRSPPSAWRWFGSGRSWKPGGPGAFGRKRCSVGRDNPTYTV